MSRLIVKNLPKQITEEKLKSVFSSKGQITDCQLKYDKKGNFRQFAFIGYKTEEEAENAKNFFHQTYVGNSKLIVETCKELGTSKSVKDMKTSKNKDKTPSNNKIVEVEKVEKDESDPFNEFKDDKEFSEFLKLQRNVGKDNKQVWSNDVTE
ncbi:putative RNA-binding protein 19-like protein, partial [Leptotrombidium deliense]